MPLVPKVERGLFFDCHLRLNVNICYAPESAILQSSFFVNKKVNNAERGDILPIFSPKWVRDVFLRQVSRPHFEVLIVSHNAISCVQDRFL